MNQTINPEEEFHDDEIQLFLGFEQANACT